MNKAIKKINKKDQPYPSKLRGVSALLESNINEESLKAAEFISLDKIKPASSQPRRYFDQIKKEQLESSVAKHGILEPLLVRPLGDQYEIVAGERRYLAAIAVRLTEVPVVIKDLNDNEALQISLIENLQREDLNPIEETEAILNLITIETPLDKEEAVFTLYRMENEYKKKSTHNVMGSDEGVKILELFESLGKLSWQSFVTNRLPLLKLPEDILLVLREGKIEYTKAKAIARIKDDTLRKDLLTEAIASSLSLVQIRERVKQLFPSAKQENILKPLEYTYKKVKKAKKILLANPKKQKKLNSLLIEINKLLNET